MNENDKVQEMFKRWEQTLRMKASEYEHPARKRGESVFYPSIDDICNEMEAFLAGRDSAL